MKIGKETILQIQVCNWMRQLHPDICFIHIANERSCDYQQGLILKRMGVKRGVSDLFMPRGNSKHKGLWLELKTESGTLTSHQKDFILDMMGLGYEAKIAHGFEHAIAIISDFYDFDSM